jgi:DNA-directed RNA polymerase subunit RPC12/RpoP
MGVTIEWRAKYEAHIRSAQWRNMRQGIIKLRGDKCEHCGYRVTLQLHHKTYERLGKELISDLELLCVPCHEKADTARAAEGQARSAAAFYGAGLDTYASKKYGDEWFLVMDREEIEEEYDRWLETKRDDYDDDY